jgi:hypothetical protein
VKQKFIFNRGITMPYRVNVELKDGSVCLMTKKSLNVFLSFDSVAKIKRKNGWVVVGKDRLRDLKKNNDYPAYAERRAHP